MNATTAHTIAPLSAAQLADDAGLGLTLCSRTRCNGARLYLATRRNAEGQHVRERLCAIHAGNFAKRHKLDLPAPTPETAPEVETIRTRGGSFDLCARCRHWLGRTDLDPGSCIHGCPCTAACHRKERAA